MPLDLLIENTSEVLTLTGNRRQGAEVALAAVPRGVVGIQEGRVAFVGPRSDLPEGALGPSTGKLDAGGGFVGPGFVDAHAHPVFAGDRSGEFELRARGKSYLEIAQAGGGIAHTVAATRNASLQELVEGARPRLSRMLAQGITTAEAKSGYGLSVEDELKLLKAIAELSDQGPIELIPTLLCAHAIPKEFEGNRAGYIQLCEEEILPRVNSSLIPNLSPTEREQTSPLPLREKVTVSGAVEGRGEGGHPIASFFDVFYEDSAFTAEETRRLCRAAVNRGMGLRLHVDQLTPKKRGAQLAAELRAASADHLEQTDPDGIAALAHSGTSAVLLPVATLFLGLGRYAPGRALWDAGVNVALGTNLNPGSAPSENLALALSLAVLSNGLTPAEAYYAATRGAALSLKRPDLGHLQLGDPADLVIFGCDSYRHLPYHLGTPHARVVLKLGRVAWQSSEGGRSLCR